MKCGQPFHFIPARFTLTDNKASFLLKNCGSAIEKLCAQGLVIANPHNNDKPVCNYLLFYYDVYFEVFFLV